jgi:hypothetical protein
MDELYKNHFIRSGAETVPESTQWRPTAEIYQVVMGKHRHKFQISSDVGKFETERLAEIEGLLLARQWIDSHIREL